MNGPASAENSPHRPVMVSEVRAALMPADGELYVDGTFGAGGYSRAFLEAADCRVIGIDRDPTAVARGREIARNYGGRLAVIEGRFSDIERLLAGEGVTAVDGVAFDYGVSSMQFDQAERGFSFRFDGPLDMRMSSAGESAADLVNRLPEAELADIIWQFGEERHSRRIAKAIVEARALNRIATTGHLASIIRSVVRTDKSGIDPATRSFQALRIRVNDELGEIERALDAAASLLRPQGRLVVVAFHSLEDRLVKRFMAQATGRGQGHSRHDPRGMMDQQAPQFRLLTGNAVKPGDAEIAANPRSRSARLRAMERLEVAA